ncbi:MAG: hypothetical protein HY906_25160 [Deltaproteobacteria bacterium]|nr:hypothetical protein [Deltaproteobacteria bacterium]
MRRAACVLVLLAFSAADAHAGTRRYAVVVAHGRSLTPGVAPLEYADDDGARYYELLSQVADEVLLYVVLDRDSQRLYPQAAKVARVPSHAAVREGLAGTFARARRDRDRGDEVVFYFVLVGHGAIGAGGEGYVSLLDAPFTRTDLFRQVIAPSPATTNHVIVDACNSYYLVHRRGDGPDRDDGAPGEGRAVGAFLAEEDLGRYPNTGVLLSTSAARESHEWSAYGAGVFSHEVRSAMAGAADVNGDGRIEYSEVRAFVAAANLRVGNPRARLAIFARAPAIDHSRPLVDLRAARFASFLHVPKGAPVRFYLEDARGVRYLDAHLAGDRAVTLGLVPSGHYYARTADGTREQRLGLGRRGRLELRRDRMAPAPIAARGATTEAFQQGLFAVPFGRGFYLGHVGSTDEAPVRESVTPWLPSAGPALAEPARGDGSGRGRRIAAWVMAGAAASLAAGGALALAAATGNLGPTAGHQPKGVGVGGTPSSAAARESTSWRLALTGGLLLGGAAAAGTTSVVLFVGGGRERAGVGVGVAGTFR